MTHEKSYGLFKVISNNVSSDSIRLSKMIKLFFGPGQGLDDAVIGQEYIFYFDKDGIFFEFEGPAGASE